MTRTLVIGLLLGVAPLGPVYAADFTLCEGTYALCTRAKCIPIAGKEGWVSCDCQVHTGYSAGQEQCQAVTTTPEGPAIRSRYYPIRSYARCSNDRPWAWCLDMPCVIDKNDPRRATCTCSVVKDQGPYVIVTDTYDEATCRSDLYSSATVTQLEQVTEFLRSRSQLPPFPIRVLNER